MMQERWLKIKEGWFNLATRERRVITVGGFVATIFVVYQLLWLPWLNHVANMRERVKISQTMLIWMRSADQAIQKIDKHKQISRTSQISSPIILFNKVKNQIDQFGFNRVLTQFKQLGDEMIEMHFQKIEFDRLIRFLLSGTQQQSITISKMTVVATGVPGLVNVEVVLKEKHDAK